MFNSMWLYLVQFLTRLISKKYRDLEIRVKGNSKSLKLVLFDSLPMITY